MRFILLSIILPGLALASVIKNESELSIIQTAGNTEVSTYNARTQTKVIKQAYEMTIGGHYFLSFYSAEDENGDEINIETARNWDYFTKLEKPFSTKLNAFSQIQIEGDTFSGFDQRNNFDIGAKYKFTSNKKKEFFTELGYRYAVEYRPNPSSNSAGILNDNKGRIYIQYSEVVSPTLTYKLWLEYLPNFTNNEDYIVNYEPSMSVLLTNIFSLKLSYQSRYDNVPAQDTNEKYDLRYTTSLIARY